MQKWNSVLVLSIKGECYYVIKCDSLSDSDMQIRFHYANLTQARPGEMGMLIFMFIFTESERATHFDLL